MFNSSRRVREQSLSHRGLGPAVEGAAAKKSWGPALKKYGKEFLIGTGATMAFAYAFEKLNGSGKSSSTPSTASATPDGSNTPNPNSANTPNTGYTGNTGDTGDTGYTGYTGNTGYTGYTGNTGNTGYTPNNDNIVYTPNTANNANNQVSSTYSPSNFPTYSSSNYPTDPSSTNAGYPTSTNTGYSTSTNPTAQTQNGYQQRAVDRDLPVDIFGEPRLESWSIDNITDGIVVISGVFRS